MRTVVSYLKPYRWRMLLGLGIKIGATMIELLLPFILSHILENVIVTLEVGRVVFFGVVMIVCAIFACIFNIVANRMAAKVSVQFSKKMRSDLFRKILYLSARDTDKFTIPSLESRITADTYYVHNFVSMMQRMGVRAPILLLGGITITMIMDSFLALVMLATLPFIFITTYFISRKGIPLYNDVQKSVDSMVRVVREDTQGIRVIKALSKNDYENRRYDTVNAKLSLSERKAGTIMSTVNPIMTLLMNMGIVGVVALSALRVSDGSSSATTVIAFMQYFTLISMAMMSIARIFTMYTKCVASARRIEEVMNTPDGYYVTDTKAHEDKKEHIVMKNVSFSYLGKKKNLDDISFSVKRGEHFGIIGATGSGKSTLVKLLLRFYEIDGGEIKINGKSITDYEKSELSSMIAIAMQNDFLYSGTITQNIDFGRNLTDEQITRAAKIAQADEFITATADGYSYLLSPKGTNLSGGQRQRLLIARAIAAEPEILILDDSSSALDYKTDANLRRALAAELTNSTVITVAQRVSSVKNCNLILVLDEGRIIGKGTHEELMESCPEYKEISDSQMGGAFVD